MQAFEYEGAHTAIFEGMGGVAELFGDYRQFAHCLGDKWIRKRVVDGIARSFEAWVPKEPQCRVPIGPARRATATGLVSNIGRDKAPNEGIIGLNRFSLDIMLSGEEIFGPGNGQMHRPVDLVVEIQIARRKRDIDAVARH